MANREQPNREQMDLPSPRGKGAHRERFLVAAPDALESDASRVNDDLSPILARAQQATPGYRVAARVIVRSRDRAATMLAAQAANVLDPKSCVRDADASGRGLKGFSIITLKSVREAARVAAALRADPRVSEAYVDVQPPLQLRALPTDPGVAQQWHIQNLLMPSASINVEPAWDSGFTGAGVTVGIVESGWDIAHPDLASKYNSDASQQTFSYFTSHGNATAGLVGAVANNGIGGTGVAYGAMLSRQYFGFASANADAESFRNDLNAIKSNSWGPADNAQLSFNASIEKQAIADAATLGRGGLGTVLVWAAGNGGAGLDRVDYDVYASDPNVMAIGSIDNQDRRALYSEPGSALMLVTTSSYDLFGNVSGVYTSSNTPGYTANFGGTSAASPIAAGVVALMLQANPNLTARDVAHVLIRSARKASPTDPGWTLNGAGLWQNYNFGFGAIDAGAAVALAQTWTNVRPMRTVTPDAVSVLTPIPDNNTAGVSSVCVFPGNLNAERVRVTLTAPHARLGDLRVELVGPSGTASLLADTRYDFTAGYAAYTFTSVRHWNENARGTWTLTISDRAADVTGSFDQWQLSVIGSAPKCPCDWNASGTMDVTDIFAFLSSWFAAQGDFNLDGRTTIDDIFAMLACWFARPPECSPSGRR